MQSRLDNRIPPPLLTLIVGVAMGAASWLLPPLEIAANLRLGLSGTLLLAAGLFGGAAFAAFGRARTTINPVEIEKASTLVTGGIYRFSRNPMYVALTALLLSLCVFLSSPWLLLGPLGFVLFITRFQILPEERVMQTKFGDACAAYRHKVRRWL